MIRLQPTITKPGLPQGGCDTTCIMTQPQTSEKAHICQPASILSAQCKPGTRCQLSERPLLCASVDWSLGEAAVGGSDHAVYILDATTCKLKRTLFKSGGHCEWVSCIAHTPGGHVISGRTATVWILSCL